MLWYILYKKDGDNKIVISVEQTKENVIIFTTENPDLYDYIHWDDSESGLPPSHQSIFLDSRTYDEKRRSGYKLECDPLFIKAQGDIADGDTEETAKTDWIAARESIKTKYPKP